MSERVTIVYARSRNLVSPLIRHADRWGRWSHCGVVLPTGIVVESRMLKGVVETPWDEFAKASTKYDLLSFEVPHPDQGMMWLFKQIGKGYDYRAVLGNLFRQHWYDDDQWHCAELVEAYLAACGRPRFRPETWRITPNQSWAVI